MTMSKKYDEINIKIDNKLKEYRESEKNNLQQYKVVEDSAFNEYITKAHEIFIKHINNSDDIEIDDSIIRDAELNKIDKLLHANRDGFDKIKELLIGCFNRRNDSFHNCLKMRKTETAEYNSKLECEWNKYKIIRNEARSFLYKNRKDAFNKFNEK